MDARAKFSRPLRRKSGFTLIEVLVVVAIIALLLSILLPTLAQARRQAKRTVCGSNLHQIGIGLLLYQQTYKTFPPQAMINVNTTTGMGEAFGLWSVTIHQTVSKLLRTGFKNSTNKDAVRTSDVFYCAEVRDADRNGDILGTDRVDANAEPYLHNTYSYLGRFDRATNDPATPRSDLGESTRQQVPNSRKHYVTNEPDGRHALMSDMLMFWGGAQVGFGAPRWRINHGPHWNFYSKGQRIPLTGSNLAFGDGHVEWKNSPKFPAEVRNSADFRDLLKTAQLRRGSDLLWW